MMSLLMVDGHGHFIDGDGVDNDAYSAGIHYWKHNVAGDNVTIKTWKLKCSTTESGLKELVPVSSPILPLKTA